MAATVLQLSDTHLFADPDRLHHGQNPRQRLETVRDAWLATGRSADAVLLTGDVTDDATDGACRQVAEILHPIGAPVFAVPGNHDEGTEILRTFGPCRPAEIGPWRLFLAPTRLPEHTEGAVDAPAVLAALDALDDRPTVLALHHPPAGPSTHPWFVLGGRRELLAGLRRRPHVKLVVAGHLHQPFELDGDGVPVLGAPSTLYAIRHQDDRWHGDDTVPTGGRILELADDGTWRTELLAA